MEDVDSLTILKFKLEDSYEFRVMDKFVEPDEAKRLDKMINESKSLSEVFGEDYEELWIKTCPIFPTRG